MANTNSVLIIAEWSNGSILKARGGVVTMFRAPAMMGEVVANLACATDKDIAALVRKHGKGLGYPVCEMKVIS